MITNRPGTIGSVDLTFRLVDEIQKRDSAGLTELADEFDISKSTVHRHLSTLKQHGYVVKEDRRYYVGLRFLDKGVYAQNRRQMFDIVQEKTRQLAELTDERAQFVIEENGWGYLLYSHVGTNGVLGEIRQGKRVYLHTTSIGKSILAHLPNNRVEEIIDKRGLPRQTSNTIVDRELLYEELEEIRENGYGFNRGERAEGLLSIGVPVLVNDKVIGGLSVTGPKRRMANKHLEDDLANPLLDMAEEMKLRLTYGTS